MLLKVIGRSIWWTLKDLWSFAITMVCFIGAVLVPMLAAILITYGLAWVWPDDFAPWLAGIIGTGIALAMMVSVFIILYLMIRIPQARQIALAEKIASRDNAVSERMRVVLARFHEDCYINREEFMDDFYMMGRLIDAHEEGDA